MANSFSSSRFTRAMMLTGKIIASLALLYLSYGAFFSTGFERIIGLVILFLVFLPTVFVFFFKKKAIADYPKVARIWRIMRVVYVIASACIFLGLAWGFYGMYNNAKTKEAISRIESRKIRLEDVMGDHLPPKPDQKINDATIAGIDANNNAIRDDVELAIFERYPDSARIRAAMLQYAQALQLELTEVFNSETLVKVLRRRSYGQSCIGKTGPDVNLTDSHDEIVANLAVSDNRIKEIDGLVLNIADRKEKRLKGLDYMTTYSIPANEQDCDIDPSFLPN